MNNFLTLALLSAMLIGSLLAAAYVHHRTETEKRRQQLIRRHKRHTERYNGLLHTLAVADDEGDVANRLNQIRLWHCRELVQYDPGSQGARQWLQQARDFQHQRISLEDSGLQKEAVARGLEECARILQEQQARGDLSDQEFNVHLAHLRQRRNMLEIDAAAERSQRALRKNDPVASARELRAEMAVVIQWGESLPDREERLQALQEQIQELEQS